jgi:hypothetical protein
MLIVSGLGQLGNKLLDVVGVLEAHEPGDVFDMHTGIQKVAGARAAERKARSTKPQPHLLAAFLQFKIDPCGVDGAAALSSKKQIPATPGLGFDVKADQFNGLAGKRNGSVPNAETNFKRCGVVQCELEVFSDEPACFFDAAATAVQNRENCIVLNLPGVGCGKPDQHQTFVGSWNVFYPHRAKVSPNP